MTALYPDHASRPVAELRVTPARWPEHLECDHCGDVAIYADADELYWDGDGGRCLTCGFPGHVSADGERAHWRTSEEPEDRCSVEGCDECEVTL